MTTNPATIHGPSRALISVIGTRRNATPSSRRSSITAIPRNSVNARTCVDSTSGYIYSDSWSAMLPLVDASHSAAGRRVTGSLLYGHANHPRRAAAVGNARRPDHRSAGRRHGGASGAGRLDERCHGEDDLSDLGRDLL